MTFAFSMSMMSPVQVTVGGIALKEHEQSYKLCEIPTLQKRLDAVLEENCKKATPEFSGASTPTQ